MTSKYFEKTEDGFSVSGFNLAKYKKTKPETYRYNSFRFECPINFVF